MTKRSSLALSLLLGCGLVTVMATPSFAGFQWIAPSDQDEASVTVLSPDLGAAPVSSTASTSTKGTTNNPIIIQGRDPVLVAPASARPVESSVSPLISTDAPAPLLSQGQSATTEPVVLLAPGAKASAPSMDSSLSSPAASSSSQILTPPPADQQEPAVQGFAKRVPLAVALRQILPSNYVFSADPDVTLSTIVSWEGGRPWRQVLNDMLVSAGMSMREQGQIVRITRGGPSNNAPVARSASAGPLDLATATLTSTDVPSLLNDVPSSRPDRLSLSAPQPVTPALARGAPMPTPVTAPAAPDSFSISSSSQSSPAYAPVSETWVASRGDTLHKVLQDWTQRAQVEFNWRSEYDYPLQATVSVTGSFEEAVRNLLTGFQDTQPQPIAHIYNNQSAGQSVLVVEARGNNFSE